MQLSRLLGLRVIDAAQHPVGTVVDVRLTLTGDLESHPPKPRVLGLVISPRTKSSFLGYERSNARAPMMLAALMRWRHRGTFLAAWDDVARVGSDLVRLRPGYTRYSAVLRDGGPRDV
jgi:sporulation protein YlmC with PRC-barrel domain